MPFLGWAGALLASALCAHAGKPAVEADWLLGAELAGASQAAISPGNDAAGGCDGIKNGQWGFHTGRERNPWWQVDLGASQSIARVILWNRCDSMRDRTAQITLLVSDDAKSWRSIYRHDGSPFGGVPDRSPLRVLFTNITARFVRVQLPGVDFLHLDEVEVFGPADRSANLALNRPSTQSSVSQWSVSHVKQSDPDWNLLTERALTQQVALRRAPSSLQRGERSGMQGEKAKGPGGLVPASDVSARQHYTKADYLVARQGLRQTLMSDPLLDFPDLLFVKRIPGSFSHMSDQYYGWWSRPGGSLFLLRDWKSENPRLINLTPGFAPGSFLKPDVSCDGKRILFSYCAFHPGVREYRDKTQKENLPEDAFYHIFEMNADGSAVRQVTRGHYDDFNARYLPSGEIVFLSTRRGTFLQTGTCAARTVVEGAMADSYVRCGGDNWRPVAVYTLHVMDAAGGSLRAISPFENFEWDPVVANDGRIVYARWDYVDRDNMPYMSLWSTNPDGTNPQLVYGNHTRSPYGVFEARPVPGSRKFVFTASAHHSISGGSLCLLDPDQGNEGAAPLARLTPEVPFPEIEGWSQTWYGTPYPLSETLFLASWSAHPLFREGQSANVTNAQGLYLYHAAGVRELIYRDPDISSCDAMPLRSRPAPPSVSTSVAWDSGEQGKLMLLDVYQGLTGIPRGAVKALRVVGVPAKVQPQMNTPRLGLTADDPGKFILGTVPVEADGSAQFLAPAGVNLFFQALDDRGVALQTMRTVTYVQPGETLSCVGCHEHRSTAPGNQAAMAANRPPSRLVPGPEGTWPFRFDQLVLPVMEAKCVRCHAPGAPDKAAAKFDLTAAKAYDSLVSYGRPSLRESVRRQYLEGRSVPGEGPARSSSLLAYLEKDPLHQPLLNREAFGRVVTWLDLYGQRLGSFSDAQEQQIVALRSRLAEMLDEEAGQR